MSDTTPDRMSLTLKIIQFSDDGEEAIVEDTHGNRASLATTDFVHDAEDIIPGDTLICSVRVSALESPIGTLQPDGEEHEEQTLSAGESVESDEPAADTDEENPAPLLTAPHNVRECGRETIEVTVELTDLERLELAEIMAEALEKRDALDAKLTSIKKSYKTLIDTEVENASKAKDEYRAGKRTQAVSCNVFEDLTTLERVYNDSVSGREVYRRPLNPDERQCKFELVSSPSQPDTELENMTRLPVLPQQLLNPHTCINCTYMGQEGSEMPDPCQTCAQARSGETDNWEPRQECKTCHNVLCMVDLYPCSGCSLNADPAHRGDKPRWTWKDAPKSAEASEDLETDSLLLGIPPSPDSFGTTVQP